MKVLSYIIPFACLSLMTVACNDIVEVDKILSQENRPSTGAPVVDRVVLATDTTMPITVAAFEQVVRFQGSNLGDVTSVKFNDVEVDPKEIYSSYECLLAPVPRQLPGEVTNMVYIVTEHGSIETPLEITIPPLTIDGMYNEFAQPGDTTIISGDNFDLYGITAEEADVRFGQIPVNILEATRTELTLQIPQNVTPGSQLSIQGGQMDEPTMLTYADPGISQLFDFNDWPGYSAFTHASQFPDAPANFLWDESIINEEEGDPLPLADGMKYIRFQGTVGAWGWMVMWAGYIDVPAEVAANPADYDMRFEMNNTTAYPIASAARIMFGNFGWYPAGDGVPVNTRGKWMTVRIPCNTIDREGNQLIPNGVDPSTLFAFTIVFSPESEQTFDVAFCNFRFVKR